MSGLFPRATRKLRFRKTCVVWDMEDYSIPENLDPYSIKEIIKSALMKDCYFSEDVSIWLYGAENTWSIELKENFCQVGFEVYPCKGDKRARLHMLIPDYINCWVLNMDEPSNLLLLAGKNKEYIEQDPKFSTLREDLENRGFFFASAHPETLINQETASQLPHLFGCEETFDFKCGCEGESAYFQIGKLRE